MLQFGFIGLSSGAALAIVALGVVVSYRGSGVLNLAQGTIGTLGAYVFWELQQLGWPIWAGILLGVAAGALASTLVYAGIIRFMAAAMDVSRMIATLGILLVLQGVSGGEQQMLSLARAVWLAACQRLQVCLVPGTVRGRGAVVVVDQHVPL